MRMKKKILPKKKNFLASFQVNYGGLNERIEWSNPEMRYVNKAYHFLIKK